MPTRGFAMPSGQRFEVRAELINVTNHFNRGNLDKAKEVSFPIPPTSDEPDPLFLIREFGSDEVRLYRNGSFPTVKKKDGLDLLGPEQAGVALEVMKSDVSSSADLAYSYETGKGTDFIVLTR